MLLTVEYGDEVVEINCDQEGLALLISKLQILQQCGGHDHLMTPSWAGTELTEEKQGVNTVLINHLRIAVRPSTKLP